MNYGELRAKIIAANAEKLPITYTVFGGQGNVYANIAFYNLTQKTLKITFDPKYPKDQRITFWSLNARYLPLDAEVLIEGYPGDEDGKQEWVTPTHAEIENECLNLEHIEDHEI